MNLPTKKQLNQWKDLLRDLPVSVNNFYGDPTLQWLNTLGKLENLLKEKHRGPVGLITKGKLTQKMAEELAYFCTKGLNVMVFLSISELPEFEKAPMQPRYGNIALLNKYKVPNVAYLRPMTPPYNTSPEKIAEIFAKLKKVGAKVAVASGFRGDDALIKEMTPDEKVQWALRVKVMTKDVYEELKINAKKSGIKLFTRTSCAVSYLSGDKTTYNPYYHSPNLAKCEDLKCPLRKTCQSPVKPKEGVLELLKFLGYEVEYRNGCAKTTCQVQPDKRLNCPSCCTTCFMLDIPRLMVKNPRGLGDLTFIRFLSGIIAMSPGMRDDGDKEVGSVRLPNYPEIEGMQCLNTWWPYATVGKTCFDCTYCIEKYYGCSRHEFGFPPSLLIDKILEINKEKICRTITTQKIQDARLVAAIA